MYPNKSEEVRGWRKLHNEEFIIYLLKNILVGWPNQSG
jgi:hypothetical protein